MRKSAIAGTRSRLLVSAGVLAITVGSAAGQTAGTSQDQNAGGQGIEQVVVSASRVTIAGYSQPTPVTVVGTAELERNAYANIEDAVRNLPQVNSPPSSFNNVSTTNNVGTNFINLRNLGATRTLVLFDGQRSVASSVTGGVDTTTLPASMVQRVDVVTGGASAAWGSDAISGVVNFVLNKNFNGFKATVQGSSTTDGLDRGLFMEGAWGGDIFGGRGHIEVAANARILPDTVLVTQEGWFHAAFFVSNPAYAAGNGQPQLIVANNVGPGNVTAGGIINSSPAGVAGPGVVAASANALRGIQFGPGGTPSLVNYGNLTQGSLSNGGSLSQYDGEAPWATIANPSNTYTLFGYGRYKLTDTVQLGVQLNYSYLRTIGGSGEVVQTSLTIKSDNAYIPASVASAMQNGGITSFVMGTLDGANYNNFTATGANYSQMAPGALAPTYDTYRRNLIRGVVSLDGTIGDDWSWNAYIEHAAMRFNAHILASPITTNLNNAEDAVTVTSANVAKSGLPLGSIACRVSLGATVPSVSGVPQPGCVPLNLFGGASASPAAIAYVIGASTNSLNYGHGETQQDVAEGSMQGTLPWALPAGKIAVAFGMGYRREGARIATNPIGASGGYTTSNFAVYGPGTSYNVIEGFGEVDAPILKDSIVKSLDFTMAGRMTSYSTSGLVETWKLGATSQVNDDIKLRTSWSVDIRAPQLSDLYNPGGHGAQTARDPKTQGTVSIDQFTTGNPNLLPEVARTVSGGVVLTPTFVPGLTLSADWYSIDLKGAITSIGINTILQQCNASLPSPINPGQNGNPNDPLCSLLVFNGPSGTLSQVLLAEINFASHTTSGLDLQANYTMDFWDGTLTWNTTDNYNDENTLTQPGAGKNDIAGSNDQPVFGIDGSATPGPKWRGVLSATYATGPYAFTVQTRWFGTSVTYKNGNTGNQATAATANLYDPAHYELPMAAYLDLRGNYKWNDNIAFYGAIDNTLNTPPPLFPAAAGVLGITSVAYFNTNNTVYDMLGRTIRVGVRFSY